MLRRGTCAGLVGAGHGTGLMACRSWGDRCQSAGSFAFCGRQPESHFRLKTAADESGSSRPANLYNA